MLKAVASGEFPELSPAPPDGYDYDVCDAEAVLGRLRVRNGRVVLPDGMQYRLFVVPDGTTAMSVPVLRKLRDLVRAGMWLVGPRPTTAYGLTGDEATLRSLASELWGRTV
jgi:(4-O-methyl)-D-glucuronate---lignin esterase